MGKTDHHSYGLAADFGLTGQLGRIVTAAEGDPDRVSMLTLTDDPPKAGPSNRAAIVLIRGHQEIEAFRRWARSQKLLADGDTGMLAALEAEQAEPAEASELETVRQLHRDVLALPPRSLRGRALAIIQLKLNALMAPKP